MTLIRRQRGFSLIEVLVSVVIMSVGILGIAGMQVISLQQNRSALLRAEALQLGNDILDRMRANPLETYAGVAFSDTPPATADNCRVDACTAEEMKDYDTILWQCSINGTAFAICNTWNVVGNMPGGQGAIVDNTGDDSACPVEDGEVCVIIRWVDNRDGTYSSVSLRSRTD